MCHHYLSCHIQGFRQPVDPFTPRYESLARQMTHFTCSLSHSPHTVIDLRHSLNKQLKAARFSESVSLDGSHLRQFKTQL